MRITLIRHASTKGNLKKQYIGKTDEDIVHTPPVFSEQQGLVYVTPLKRTAQTAAALFPNKHQQVVPALVEMDFGIFEGKNYQEMEDFLPYRQWVEGGCLDSCPNGESREAFSKRVCKGFLELLDISAQEDMVFVVHGGVVMALMHHFCPEKDYFSWHCENCCGYTFEFSNKCIQDIRSVCFCTS